MAGELFFKEEEEVEDEEEGKREGRHGNGQPAFEGGERGTQLLGTHAIYNS